MKPERNPRDGSETSNFCPTRGWYAGSKEEDVVTRMDPAERVFVSYIDRTREFYLAQGYEKPYRWAHFEEVPFARVPKPLSECRLTLVTTASPDHDGPPMDGVLRGAKAVWSGPMASPPEHLYTDHLAWDKQATHTLDVESFLPVARLQSFAAEGRVGELAQHFHGVPTDYSQRRTAEEDASEIARRCREDGVDAALLIPI